VNDIADSTNPVHPPDATTVSAWEEPRRIDRDAAPVLAADGFEGSLDWWLEMARAQKIDLAKISIATLIGAFATAMEAALSQRVEGQLARWAVWLARGLAGFCSS
jgi:segregation and condensation protein A